MTSSSAESAVVNVILALGCQGSSPVRAKEAFARICCFGFVDAVELELVVENTMSGREGRNEEKPFVCSEKIVLEKSPRGTNDWLLRPNWRRR